VVGIQPRWAETGYGYIEFPPGVHAGREPIPVRSFREKPKLRVAKRLFAAGHYYWNSGMFFWQARVLLAELRKHQPRMATLLSSLPPFGDKGFQPSLKRAFPRCEDLSIDHAVLEHARNVAGVPAADFGWNDVGSWNAVYELAPRDGTGNVAAGDLLCHKSSGNYVYARKKLVALLGVDDLIVVDTPDALLVAGRDRAQQVGEIVKRLESQKRDDLL
jgi:mannose-1-phosphate guanylyltransferase